MKFSTLAVSLFTVFVSANPLLEALKAVSDSGSAAAASVTYTITGDGVRYRTCPNTSSSCKAVGQYAKGTRVTFTYYTNGQTIDGTSFWDRNTDGYYITEAYIQSDCAARVTTYC